MMAEQQLQAANQCGRSGSSDRYTTAAAAATAVPDCCAVTIATTAGSTLKVELTHFTGIREDRLD